jgi:hypothetical protein
LLCIIFVSVPFSPEVSKLTDIPKLIFISTAMIVLLLPQLFPAIIIATICLIRYKYPNHKPMIIEAALSVFLMISTVYFGDCLSIQ